MIEIGCSQFAEFKLELAGYISDELKGTGVALVQSDEIVIDPLSDSHDEASSKLVSIIQSFLKSRDLVGRYVVVDSFGDFIDIQAQPGTPITKQPRGPGLPPNVFQCPHCGHIAGDEFQARLHEQIHYLRF